MKTGTQHRNYILYRKQTYFIFKKKQKIENIIHKISTKEKSVEIKYPTLFLYVTYSIKK